MTTDDPFRALYDTKSDREDWGEFFCGPEQLENGKETLIAAFPRTGADGHDVEVYVDALPARFYSVRVLGGSIRFSTGSGHEMAELARQVAQEIASGMVDLEVVA